VDLSGIAPESPACKAGVFLLDDKPIARAEAVRLELTSDCSPPPVFGTGSSSGRMTSVDLQVKVPGVGIEPTTSWFRAKRRYQQQLPRITQCPRHSRQQQVRDKFRGQESNLRTPGSKPGITTSSDDPGMLSPRVPCGNRTCLASLEGWHLCRSVKGTHFDQLRREELNLHRLA
jgi:hypothetical protein